MTRSDLTKLSDLLVKVANAPMADANFALGMARHMVYLELIREEETTMTSKHSLLLDAEFQNQVLNRLEAIERRICLGKFAPSRRSSAVHGERVEARQNQNKPKKPPCKLCNDRPLGCPMCL